MRECCRGACATCATADRGSQVYCRGTEGIPPMRPCPSEGCARPPKGQYPGPVLAPRVKDCCRGLRARLGAVLRPGGGGVHGEVLRLRARRPRRHRRLAWAHPLSPQLPGPKTRPRASRPHLPQEVRVEVRGGRAEGLRHAARQHRLGGRVLLRLFSHAHRLLVASALWLLCQYMVGYRSLPSLSTVSAPPSLLISEAGDSQTTSAMRRGPTSAQPPSCPSATTGTCRN